MIATMTLMPEWASAIIGWLQVTLIWLYAFYQMWVVFEKLVGWRKPEEPSAMHDYRRLALKIRRRIDGE